MKIAYVLLENFAISIELRNRPELAARPVIIGGLPSERKMVYDLSPEAAAYGVKIGMPLRQAYQTCPPAVFVEPDHERYAAAFEEILGVMDGFSPRVEVDGPGKAFLDLTGAGRSYGGEERMLRSLSAALSRCTGITPRIGMSSCKHVARLAAQLSHGSPLIVSEGAEAEMIAPLPIECLPCSDEVKRSLRFFGLRTVGEVAHLPLEALSVQFGKEGEAIYRFARCVNHDLVIPRLRPMIFEGRTHFEDAITNSVYLLAVLGELIDGLALRLRREHRLCRKLKLKLDFDKGGELEESIDYRYPTASTIDLMRPVTKFLERLECRSGVAGATVFLMDMQGGTGEQLGFSSRGSEKRRHLEVIAGSIKPAEASACLRRALLADVHSGLSEKKFSIIGFDEAASSAKAKRIWER
ncbi:MAG: hypothetical protein M1319_05435 [Chloroflexi bacterium]|nr:hypothetical protein [Chloroflexota bacterium]